jgi:VIT1/CCC1 family predicted Fe2+/Mn2+ transporter
MMRFEVGLERPNPQRAPISAATIAIAYIVGGLIPLLPYILGLKLHWALIYSVVFTGIALALFGAVKGRLTGINMVKSAFQTMFVGGVAAGAAFYFWRLCSADTEAMGWRGLSSRCVRSSVCYYMGDAP